MTTRQAAVLKVVKGEYFSQANQAEKALEAFNEALALSPIPPHEYLRSQGVDLRRHLEHPGERRGLFYRTIYLDFAVTHLTLGQFAEALDAAKPRCCTPQPTRGWLLKAFALYGLDRWEEGEDAFAQAHRYYTDDGRHEARVNRAVVLKQLCARPTPPAQVCEHWKMEMGEEAATRSQ